MMTERISSSLAYITDEHSAPSASASSLWTDFLIQHIHPHEARLTVHSHTSPADLQVHGNLISAFTHQEDDLDRPTCDFLWDIGNGLVRAESIYNNTELRIRVITDGNFERATEILDSLRQQIKTRPTRKANEVKIKFWRMSSNGGSAFSRNIAAPTWRSIERNYPHHTALQLSQLMRLRSKQIGTGKVILLHGPPGTGKTTAIRSLAREWRQWCTMSYAIDPERVFGSGEYLTTIIADGDDDDYGENPSGGGKWRLLVIEDAEEFLVPDAKHEVGQAVSRLLNVGDGILGQGLRLMVMLTTNMPVDKLSPAITRPGRCLANIEVPKFPRDQASNWLGQSVNEEKTLAELWELAHPSQIGTGLSVVQTAGQYL